VDFFDDHTECGCCGFHASNAKLNEMSLAQTERTLVDYAGLTKILRAETNDAPFIPSEVALTELLAENADSLAAKVEQPIYDVLTRSGYVDEAKIVAALKAANSTWEANAWPKRLENEYRKTLAATALLGQHDIPFGPELDDLSRLRITNGMAKSAKYYTNRYFNTQVMPALADAAHVAVMNGTSHDGAELQAIRALLDRRLRSVPYWNLVANAAASRAYHYGYIKTGVAAGLDTIQFVAIIDERTSAICISLNGTQWQAADVSLFADRIADADGDNIKNVAPWPKLNQIIDKTPAELLAMGVVIPPCHGRCRSQLFFV
jgi:hypothetical protein